MTYVKENIILCSTPHRKVFVRVIRLLIKTGRKRKKEKKKKRKKKTKTRAPHVIFVDFVPPPA